VSRLADGTAALARRYRIWLWEEGVRAGLTRAIGGVAAAGFVGGICLAAPILTFPVASLGLLAAWGAGKPTADGGQAPTDEDCPNDYTAEEFLAHLHNLMATADRLHLAQVAAELYDDPAATAQVRDQCAAAGVTITRGVRVPQRGVSTGLYRRDLPPLPSPSSTAPVAVVAAGQGEQQQQQHDLGEGFTITPDPDGNPHRWAVQWDDQPARKAS